MEISIETSYNLYIIRVIACIAVVLGHFFSAFNYGVFAEELFFPYIQSLAVIVFFYLSGFLSVFSMKRTSSFCIYIRHRFNRIYLFLLPSIIFIWIIDRLNIMIAPTIYRYYYSFNVISLIKSIFLIPEFGRGGGINPLFVNHPFGTGEPLWTLFIEWWLYIIIGGIYYNRKKIRLIVPVITLFIVFFISLGRCGWCCVVAFLMGYFSAYIKVRSGKLQVIVSLLLFLICCVVYKDAYILPVVLTLVFFLFCVKDYPFIKERKNVSDLLKVMAEITFPIYLLHYSCLMLVQSIFSGIHKCYIYEAIAYVSLTMFFVSLTFAWVKIFKKLCRYIWTCKNRN